MYDELGPAMFPYYLGGTGEILSQLAGQVMLLVSLLFCLIMLGIIGREILERLKSPPEPPHPPAPRAYASSAAPEPTPEQTRGVPEKCPHLDRTRGGDPPSPYPDRMCAACAALYADLYAATCARCGEHIHPSFPVAVAWEGADEPYTHLECAESSDLYCGRWGKGRLLSLHFLEPDTYPSGTRSLRSHSAKLH